jgi:hypothetical protein
MGSNLTQKRQKLPYLLGKGAKFSEIRSSEPNYPLGVKRLSLTTQ